MSTFFCASTRVSISRKSSDLFQRVDDHERIEAFLTTSTLSLLFAFITLLVFSGVLARFPLAMSVSYRGQTERAAGDLVSGNYFEVLGVRALIGRTFTQDDDRTPGAHPVVVVSHAWWQRKLGGDPAAIGRTITIDKTAYTIIGVAPPEFFGTTVGEAPELWAPLAMEAQMPPAYWNGRNDRQSGIR